MAHSQSGWFDAKVQACTEAAWAMMMKGQHYVYLYFKQGDLIVAAEGSEPPESWGMELATPQRLPTHLEKQYLHTWISNIARRLPCLPVS